MTEQPHNQTAFPLAWPNGWARTRTEHRERAPFWKETRGDVGTYRRERSMAEATKAVIDELGRMSARSIVISTNVQLRADGLPMSNRRAPSDPGAAVYFTLPSAKAVALACDKWRRVEDNIYAIAMHVEALRGQKRWGVGNMEQAFAGYLRLAAPGESGAAIWYHVFGVSADATFDQARAAYIAKAKLAHPDLPGGSHEAMRALNVAWDMARQHFGR
jgi:hypothetical protein